MPPKSVTSYLFQLLPAALLTVGLSAISANASTYSLLYSFTGQADGKSAHGGVVQDQRGNLYGETGQGGSTKCKSQIGLPQLGCGTVYRLSPAGTLTTLAKFIGRNGAYGDNTMTLINGTLYGSTIAGGTGDSGVLFSVHTDGSKFTLLHQFSGSDGLSPSGSLVKGEGQVLYGLTRGGGAAGDGVLFKIKPDGTYTILHTFTGGSDGAAPATILVSVSGSIIGSTLIGGHKTELCYPAGCGTVFEYSPSTGSFRVLHTFVGTDGGGAYVGSIGPQSILYGNSGFLFSLSQAAGFTLLNQSAQNVGCDDLSGPVLLATGSLVGTEYEGPLSTGGTLYQFVEGTETVLHGFGGSLGTSPDGLGPEAQPIVSSDGSIIGTTVNGGSSSCNCGTIWKYAP